jgi:phage N-6-adenine-methyltransferase
MTYDQSGDGKHYWLTPPDIYKALDDEFHFDFDPCPYPRPEGFDGQEVEWGQSNYVNPPFQGPTAWVRKAIAEQQNGKTVVLMFPLDKWVHRLLEAGAEVRNFKDVRWLSIEEGKAGRGNGRWTAAFILRPPAKAEPTVMTKGMMSSERSDWETPPEVFDPLHAEFGFTLDVCATAETAKCIAYFGPAEDGLKQPWLSRVCWMNPPYGREIGKWVQKAYEESKKGATVVCLLPARTDTRWWHTYCTDAEVRFIRGRVKFIRDGVQTAGTPFPSAVVIFRGNHA